MEEREHILHVLGQTSQALKNNDAVTLNELSNQTIHCASCIQDSGSITIAVLNYALSKIIERGQQNRIKNWAIFVKRFSIYINSAAQSLSSNNQIQYEEFLKKARATLEGTTLNLKPYIQEIMRKASINKASKLYDHGISLGQTANLLGITQWELSDYAGSRAEISSNINQAKNIKVKDRAKMALEFFG